MVETDGRDPAGAGAEAAANEIALHRKGPIDRLLSRIGCLLVNAFTNGWPNPNPRRGVAAPRFRAADQAMARCRATMPPLRFR